MLTIAQRPNANDAAGFSLIELMVTLSLLGFLLLLGLPAFTTMVKNAQVRTVADALQNGIRIARTEALRTNQQTVFALTNATPTLNVTPAANGVNWWVQSIPHIAGDAASAVPNGSGVLTDVASGTTITGPAVICFNSNGRLTNLTSAAIGLPGSAVCSAASTVFQIRNLRAPEMLLNVVVAIGGQVRLCDFRRSIATSPDGC